MTVPVERLPSPCYAIDRALLARNLEVLDRVQRDCGARIILALKGFALFAAFPQIAQVLRGTTASSLSEARLGHEEFGGEVHVYAVAYRDEEFEALLGLARHITFNSLPLWDRFRARARAAADRVSFGIRINPEYSEVKTELYNPCRPGTRFGVAAAALRHADLEGIEGLHFHTMCEQNADTLERTMDVVDRNFGDVLRRMRWLNMGGGHHITRPDYDVERLCRVVRAARERYGVEVYLEPGEAIALHTGFLVSTVLDRFRSGDEDIAILDTSATAHMPDVLEMPYRPQIIGGGGPGEKAHTLKLGGLTCLAGDEIGVYSFDQPLAVGDRLVFTDMAHYTMVKNTTFNGVDLPAIALFDSRDDSVEVVRRFGYADYRNRLS